jgi:uncharacterized protein YndB with AHSA1/START domain
MTLVDRTQPKQNQSISFEFDLPHPPEKVWHALTDPELLEQWLLPVVDLALEPGAVFTLQAPPQAGWDGTVDCRVLEIDERSKLSYAWVVGDPESDFFLDTVVTFTLAPTPSGTRMTLVQSGFEPDQKRNWGGARYGWKMMGGRLVDLLERLR